MAWTSFDELRDYPDIKYNYGYGEINKTLPDEKVKSMRQGYYSALSYTDSLIGQVHTTFYSASNIIIVW